MHAGWAGAWIGAAALGCLVPLLLAIYCALVLNDMGGLLFWPIVIVFDALVGLMVGGIVGSIIEIARMRRSGAHLAGRADRIRWILLVIILVPAAVLAFTMGGLGSWYLDFRQQMQMAERHAPLVQQVLAADGRFPNVDVYAYTGNQGLVVTGDVLPVQADEVRRVVESTQPPVPVEYDLSE